MLDLKRMKSKITNIKVGRKSIFALTNIKKGERFNYKNIIIKRPGTGITPMKINKIIGFESDYNFQKDDFIKVKRKI